MDARRATLSEYDMLRDRKQLEDESKGSAHKMDKTYEDLSQWIAKSRFFWIAALGPLGPLLSARCLDILIDMAIFRNQEILASENVGLTKSPFYVV